MVYDTYTATVMGMRRC